MWKIMSFSKIVAQKLSYGLILSLIVGIFILKYSIEDATIRENIGRKLQALKSHISKLTSDQKFDTGIGKLYLIFPKKNQYFIALIVDCFKTNHYYEKRPLANFSCSITLSICLQEVVYTTVPITNVE